MKITLLEILNAIDKIKMDLISLNEKEPNKINQ